MRPTTRFASLSQSCSLALGLALVACQASPTDRDAAQAPAPAQGTVVHTLTYVPGPNWDPDKPVSEQGLDEHFAYMGTLYERGTLLANGPYGDAVRGLYVLALPDEAAVSSVVDGDPAVRDGKLVPERIAPWLVMMDALDRETDEEFFLLEYRPGSSWSEGKPLQEQPVGEHLGYVTELFERGELIAGGPLPAEDGGRYIVAVADQKAAVALVKRDPGVRSMLFEVEIHPWRPVQRQRIRG